MAVCARPGRDGEDDRELPVRPQAVQHADGPRIVGPDPLSPLRATRAVLPPQGAARCTVVTLRWFTADPHLDIVSRRSAAERMDAQTVRRYRPWRMTAPLFSAQPSSPWVWESMVAITLVLVALNVLLVVLVHGRRIRQSLRRGRERRFQAQLDEVMAKLDHPTSLRDRLWLRWQLDGFDELERPLAAVALIERLRPASAEERREVLATLREVGAVELLVGSTGSRVPWRRALAVRTLGWAGAEETVPVLIERVGDRSRYVREAAVRALGRVCEPQALPLLGELFRAPGRVAPGVVYDALVSFGAAAAPTFAGALRSELESVRVASCYGVAAVSEPGQAAAELEPLLTDPQAPVRAAAAEALGAGGRRPAAGRPRTSLPRRGRNGAGGRHPRARRLR